MTNDHFGLPRSWDYFFASLIYLTLIPLAPLGVECFLNKGVVTTGTLYLTTAIYAITIGPSSNSQTTFNLSVLVSLAFCLGFGFSDRTLDASQRDMITNLSAISVMTIVHIIERVRRHIFRKDAFPDYIKSNQDRDTSELLNPLLQKLDEMAQNGEENSGARRE